MTLPVDFTSQGFFRDPAATVRRLQAAGPVVEARFPMVGRVWMTTTQEMASRVLKDGKLFGAGSEFGAGRHPGRGAVPGGAGRSEAARAPSPTSPTEGVG